MKKFIRVLLLICSIITVMSCISCNSSSVKVSSDELYKFSFKFNNVTYTIPEKIDTFISNGWTFSEKFDKLDKSIKSGGLESTYLEQGENWFNVEIYNGTDGELPVKECKIGRITYDFSGDIEVYTAGDFHLNDKTLDEVVAVYGEPMSKADYSLYTEIIYDKNPESSLYDRYTFRFDKTTKVINYIDITNY